MRTLGILLTLALAATAMSETAAQTATQRPQDVFNRAVTNFESGRVVESVAGFDEFLKIVPSAAPQLWQRGIALYYAGRYKDCRAQFESHRTVNPDDVENAAWHFLCVARAESPDQARKALLPVGTDPRVPMPQIYDMFRGTKTPADILMTGGSSASGQFYARLYIGLYYEAIGNDRLALENISAAAADRFATAGGYMHTVAKVHLQILQRKK